MSGFNIIIGSVSKIIKSRETHALKQDFKAYKDIRLNNYSNYKGRQMLLKKLPSVILQKLGMTLPARSTKNHMNPLEYWYNTNNNLKTFQDNYFKENIDRITNLDLKSDCQNLYNSGNAIEKNQVLTLLSAVKLHF